MIKNIVNDIRSGFQEAKERTSSFLSQAKKEVTKKKNTVTDKLPEQYKPAVQTAWNFVSPLSKTINTAKNVTKDVNKIADKAEQSPLLQRIKDFNDNQYVSLSSLMTPTSGVTKVNDLSVDIPGWYQEMNDTFFQYITGYKDEKDYVNYLAGGAVADFDSLSATEKSEAMRTGKNPQTSDVTLEDAKYALSNPLQADNAVANFTKDIFWEMVRLPGRIAQTGLETSANFAAYQNAKINEDNFDIILNSPNYDKDLATKIIDLNMFNRFEEIQDKSAFEEIHSDMDDDFFKRLYFFSVTGKSLEEDEMQEYIKTNDIDFEFEGKEMLSVLDIAGGDSEDFVKNNPKMTMLIGMTSIGLDTFSGGAAKGSSLSAKTLSQLLKKAKNSDDAYEALRIIMKGGDDDLAEMSVEAFDLMKRAEELNNKDFTRKANDLFNKYKERGLEMDLDRVVDKNYYGEVSTKNLNRKLNQDVIDEANKVEEVLSNESAFNKAGNSLAKQADDVGIANKKDVEDALIVIRESLSDGNVSNVTNRTQLKKLLDEGKIDKKLYDDVIKGADEAGEINLSSISNKPEVIKILNDNRTLIGAERRFISGSFLDDIASGKNLKGIGITARESIELVQDVLARVKNQNELNFDNAIRTGDNKAAVRAAAESADEKSVLGQALQATNYSGVTNIKDLTPKKAFQFFVKNKKKAGRTEDEIKQMVNDYFALVNKGREPGEFKTLSNMSVEDVKSMFMQNQSIDWMEALNAYRYSNMLSGVVTQTVNAVGNLAEATYGNIVRGAGEAALYRVAGGTPSTLSGVGSYVKNFASRSNIGTALRKGWDVMLGKEDFLPPDMISLSNPEKKIPKFFENWKIFTRPMFAVDAAFSSILNESYTAKLVKDWKIINKTDEIPAKTLEKIKAQANIYAEDSLLRYRRDLETNMGKKSYYENKSIIRNRVSSPNEWSELQREGLITTSELSELRSNLTSGKAKYNTMPPSERKIVNKINNRAIKRFFQKNPWELMMNQGLLYQLSTFASDKLRQGKDPNFGQFAFSFVQPFVNTLSNIVGKKSERLPIVGLFNALTIDKGLKLNKAEMNKILADQIYGIINAGIAYRMVDLENYKPLRDPNDPNNKYSDNDGRDYGSFRLGDTWHSLEFLGGSEMPFAIGAELKAKELRGEIDLTDKNTIKQVTELLFATLTISSDSFIRSLDSDFLQGTIDFLNITRDPTEKTFAKTTQNIARQFIPLVGLIGSTNRSFIDRERKVGVEKFNEIPTALMKDIPGLSQNVPARRGPDGKILEYSDASLFGVPGLAAFVSPTRTKVMNEDMAETYEIRKDRQRLNDLTKVEGMTDMEVATSYKLFEQFDRGEISASELNDSLPGNKEQKEENYEEYLKQKEIAAQGLVEKERERMLNLSASKGTLGIYLQERIGNMSIEERKKWLGQQVFERNISADDVINMAKHTNLYKTSDHIQISREEVEFLLQIEKTSSKIRRIQREASKS